ncbi:MAG: Rrf2 family transcriptional regulator [Planctomycetota bacterium]
MKLSKRSVYGLQAAVRLARRNGSSYLQSREIAEHEKLPAKFLESILLALRSAELLESKVGAGGGYRLARPADQITIAQLLDALDHEEQDVPAEVAETDGQFALVAVNERIESAMSDAIGSLSLTELLELSEEKQQGSRAPMYYI